jgi:aryl-alcohol dehydrogenase-like predicted oxidoreductase
MEYRTLGRSGLKVSVLTMGTMTFGGAGVFAAVGDTDAADARTQVDMCLEAGVNLIDTADMYSAGAAEEIVGEVLRGRRDDVLVATKARFPMGSGPNDEGLSRHHLIRSCEAGLRRLGTDHIDLYQLHERDGLTPVEETLEALQLLLTQGKIRYVGASNFSAWHLMKALGIADRDRLPRFVSHQIHYSLQALEAEYELLPLALDQGVGIMVWSPLAAGLLSGKYRRDRRPDGDSRHLTEWGEPPVYDEEALWRIVDALVEVADGRGVSGAQVALAWLLGRPAVSTLVIGARTSEQLRENLAAAELTLSDDERRRLDEASEPPLLYPYWHQVRTAAGRLSDADLSLLRRHLPAPDRPAP